METPASLLTQAAKRHTDIQQSIKAHAAELAKSVGPQREEEVQPSESGNPGQ